MRELAEEAGWRIKPKHLDKLGRVAGVKKSKRAGDRELHYYLLKVDKEVAPRLNREHSDYRWLKHKRLHGKYNLPTAVAIECGWLKNVTRAEARSEERRVWQKCVRKCRMREYGNNKKK